MTRFEYKVIPAPRRGEKARGAKTTEDRFALVLGGLMNRMGRDGWEYLRADTLPCEERSGFRGHSTTFQNMLIFRRALPEAAEAPTAIEAPAAEPQAGQTLAESPPSEPLAAAAEAKLASIHPIGPARGEGPRLVTPSRDATGKAPALGPANRGGGKGDTPAE